MEKSLKEIFLDHKQKKSDKWSLYINEWDRIFSPYRHQPINIFEIGIQNGGSLEIWATYFSNAKKIVGCDIDEKCKELVFDDPRITVYVGDANSAYIQ
jgi:cephalosporin hydroxylase